MSGQTLQDETLFCERCGITFLWPVEEQKTQGADSGSAQTPLYCPGCRYLLPAPGRERALVKFFNGRKQFGFLTRRNAPELYVHGSAITDHQRLVPGDLVEFTVIESERGPAAGEVVLLEKAVRDDKMTR